MNGDQIQQGSVPRYTPNLSDLDSYMFRIKLALTLGLIAGFVLSPTLWLSSRVYPLTPVFHFLPPVPPPFDLVVLVAMVLLAVWAAAARRPFKPLAGLLAVAVAYATEDQSRWQPWFYQYVTMLAALLWWYARSDDAMRRERALAACRLIVAAVYFWSGLHKINPGFLHSAFPWMLEPLRLQWLAPLAPAVPIVEAAIGAGLLIPKFRRTAVIGALAMHAFILASIGPLGRNFDQVVWPWNIAMACLVVLLFWRPVWEPKAAAPKLAVVLCAIMPALSFLGVWDNYLSFAMYSGNSNQAWIYMPASVADRLPDELQEHTAENPSKVDTIDITQWSYAELNVPPYAELRIYRNIGRKVCSAAGNPREMVMVVHTKSDLLHRRRQLVYTCSGL
jgi:uncharacterized membrane protein YphA (DoxX/SURF4 family)